MITQELINNIKDCIASKTKKIKINDDVIINDIEVMNLPNTDNVEVRAYIKPTDFNKITNVKLLSDTNKVLVSRDTDTIVTIEFFYKFLLRIIPKETRFLLDAVQL